MKHRARLGRLALAACLAAAALPFAASAQTQGPGGTLPPDMRQVVPVNAAQRQAVLHEMRDFLFAVHRIMTASLAGDMKGAAAAARYVGLSHFAYEPADKPKAVHGLGSVAPDQFRQIGAATHAGFDQIAQLAEQSGDSHRVLTQLTENMTRCLACHAAYKFPDPVETPKQTTLPRTVMNPPHSKPAEK